MIFTEKVYLRCYSAHYLFILLLLPLNMRNDWSSTTIATTTALVPSSVKMISSLRRKERRHHYPSIHYHTKLIYEHHLQWNLLMVDKGDSNVFIEINEQQQQQQQQQQKQQEQEQEQERLVLQSMKQQFAEPFDRWRLLQNFLDDDDNNTVDPSLILLLLQTLVRQKQSELQQERETCTSLSLRLVESTPVDNNNSSNKEIDSNTNIAGTTTIATTMNDDSDKDTTRITEYIVNELSIETLQKLLQPTEFTTDEMILLQQIELLLLPNPVEDEDAHKGLWDTIIELHGRESVKINERNASNANSSGGWKTRCLISRLLIHYDFLSNGIKRDEP